METMVCFIRYLVPAVLALVTVILLTAFNHFVGPLIWAGRLAERMEVFSYTILIAGPLAFAISFLLFFYGIELRKEPWPLAKTLFAISCLMAVVGFVANISCLPRVRKDMLEASMNLDQGSTGSTASDRENRK